MPAPSPEDGSAPAAPRWSRLCSAVRALTTMSWLARPCRSATNATPHESDSNCGSYRPWAAGMAEKAGTRSPVRGRCFLVPAGPPRGGADSRLGRHRPGQRVSGYRQVSGHGTEWRVSKFKHGGAAPRPLRRRRPPAGRTRGPGRARRGDRLPVGVGHVERVHDHAGHRRHAGRADVQARPAPARAVMRESRPISSSPRNSTTVASVASSNQCTDGAPARRAGGPARVDPFLLGQLVGQAELALQRPGQVAAHERRVGHAPEARLDDEAVDRHAGVRADRRLADVERVQGEHPGGAVQRAGGVRRGDDDLVVADDDGQLARLGQRAPLVVERRDLRRRARRRPPRARGGPGRRSAGPSSRSTPPARWPRRRRGPARAAGRAARPSRATDSRTMVIVFGSSMSRRVAVLGSSRWWRTSPTIIARSSPVYPIRRGDGLGVLGADDRVVAARDSPCRCRAAARRR